MPRTREADREYQRARRARLKAERTETQQSAVPPPKSSSTSSPPRRGPGPHRRAVTRMLRHTGLLHVPEEAPLVELVKSLARRLDDGDDVESKYRTALADVRRVLAYTARPSSSADRPSTSDESAESTAEPEEGTARVNSLASFRAKRGIG